MSTGTGTFADPIVAMSASPVQIALDVHASLAALGNTDDPAYWIDKESTPAEFSNHLWHLGHNRYWEARQVPGSSGSAEPNLGRLPAIHRATDQTPSPPLPPPDTPAPQDVVLAALTLARLNQIETRLAAIEGALQQIAARPLPPIPSFSGTINLGWPLGTRTITLTPKP